MQLNGITLSSPTFLWELTVENADVLFTEDRKLRVELKFIERHEEENTHLDYLPYLLHRNVTSLQHIAIGEYKIRYFD